MSDYKTGSEASDAYGGYLGDPSGAAAKILEAALEALSRADAARNPLEWAEANYRYGNAMVSQMHIHASQRFDGALRAFEVARDLWETIGTDAQRAKGWTATGNAWKNLVTGTRSENLERAIHDHIRALECARLAEDEVLLANAHNGLAVAYRYREIGDKAANVEAAVNHQEQATALYAKADKCDRVAISMVNCGLAWAKHPDSERGLQRAAIAYAEALRALGSGALPAPHMRRLGSSAGFTALRLGDWATAVQMYQIAYDATDVLLGRATTPEGKAHELAEHGSITTRLASALVLSGDPLGAADLVESSRRRTLRQLTQGQLAAQGNVPVWEQLEEGEAVCYVAASVAGTVCVLITGFPSVTVQSCASSAPDLDEIQAAVGVPPIFPGHGRAVAAQLLPADSLVRDIPKATLDAVHSGVLQPLAALLVTSRVTSLTLVPVDAVADLPLHTGLLDTRSSGHRANIRVSYASSARLALGARSRARVARRRPRLLVGVGVEESPLGSLPAARSELEAVARAFPGPTRLLYSSEASLDAVQEALPRASHVHLACHGRFLHSDPESSYFELAGGERLTLDMLSQQGLLVNARLVVVTACDMGSTDALHWADASDGLASRLLAEGAGNLIAPIRPVYDVVAALFSSRLYRELFADDLEADSALALARAQQWLRDLTGSQLRDWLAEHPALLPNLHAKAPRGGDTLPLWADVPSLWAAFCHFGLP